MPVPDASILAASIIPDDVNFGIARTWIGAQVVEAATLHAPSTLVPEVVGAVRRRESEHAALMAFASLVEGEMTFHPVTLPLARSAAELAAALGLRGRDAIYVALAQQLDEVLVSFDSEQLERAAKVVRVLRPE